MRPLTFDRLATYLLFLGIATAACLMPAQSDTFWQLRAGQEMTVNGRVLLEDTFTHTVRGAFWPNHEWLSQVVFYFVHAAGGLPGLTAFAAALVTLSWICMWQIMQGPVAVRLVLVLVLIAPSARLWSLRPQLVSLLLLCVTCLLVHQRRTKWIPLLFLAWANFHGGVMLGLAALGGALAGIVWVDRRQVKAAVATLTASAAAVCLTPLGLTVWTEIPQMLQRLDAYGVREWQSASLTNPFDLPFWLAAIALIGFFIRNCRTVDRETAAISGAALALIPLAVESSRNITPFMLVAAPALSRLLPVARSWAPQRRRRERLAFNMGFAVTASAACVAGIAAAWSAPLARLNWAPVPHAVAREVSACRGNIYNLYDNGGYLVWFVPQKPVFMDSRQDPFPVELVSAQIAAERTGEYGALFEKYNVRCAALPPESRVAKALGRAGWQVVSHAPQWVVLVTPPTS
jgi:hypothetical protein